MERYDAALCGTWTDRVGTDDGRPWFVSDRARWEAEREGRLTAESDAETRAEWR